MAWLKCKNKTSFFFSFLCQCHYFHTLFVSFSCIWLLSFCSCSMTWMLSRVQNKSLLTPKKKMNSIHFAGKSIYYYLKKIYLQDAKEMKHQYYFTLRWFFAFASSYFVYPCIKKKQKKTRNSLLKFFTGSHFIYWPNCDRLLSTPTGE